MEQRQLGRLWPVSVLTLGGGGLGQLWGATSRAECVATVREAVDAGITLLDLAPLYGDGESERVVGEAFAGRLPAGVRITTKCLLAATPPGEVERTVRTSLERSLRDLRLDHVDLFFLHSNLAPDGYRHPGESHPLRAPTPWSTYRETLRPLLEDLVGEGLVGAWGLTGIGLPGAIIDAFADEPAPAAVQCIANLLDSPGGLKLYAEPARPRDIIRAAGRRGVGVLGIRAVQAGALTDGFDRDLPADHPEVADFRRARPFRALAREVGAAPADLAHRYALSMAGVASVVLGIKNRAELRACVAAAAAGPLEPDLVARIDSCVRATGSSASSTNSNSSGASQHATKSSPPTTSP
ncbi:MAG: aldo/keto reductase [Alphaproteobacteria bacterium]|nr:aldo/keto reductase [Alphaproteobacteria bacterium]